MKSTAEIQKDSKNVKKTVNSSNNVESKMQ